MQAYIILNDGTKIPQFGLGVYQIPEGEATYNAVLDALKMGVRHIDTAHAYQNERSVGKAVPDTAEVYSPNLSGIGHNELIVGKALEDVRDDVVIAKRIHSFTSFRALKVTRPVLSFGKEHSLRRDRQAGYRCS